MRGFPKKIATSEDMYNCLGLVQAGELPATELTEAITKIEEKKYISIPILGLSEDRKTVIISDCAEAAAGAKVKSSSETKISTVAEFTSAVADAIGKVGGLLGAVIDTGGIFGKHEGNDTEEGATEQKKATVVLTKALPVGETFLKIVAPRDPFAALGISETEINNIKGVLERYVTLPNK